MYIVKKLRREDIAVVAVVAKLMARSWHAHIRRPVVVKLVQPLAHAPGQPVVGVPDGVARGRQPGHR